MPLFPRNAVPFLPLLAAGCGGATPPPAMPASAFRWEQLPSLPDREGFASPFAGVSDGKLLVAGGANFPGKKPWEGGTKVWSDAVFVLDRPHGTWRTAGKLPRPLGYGVSVTADDSVFCFGGSDATRHHADGFRVRLKDGKPEATPLPALPKPCANAAWAMAGRTLYVVGGIETPDATACLRTLWALALDNLAAGWRELPPCPGRPRMLAVTAGFDGALFVFGGTDLHAGPDGKPVRTYLRDGWRFTPSDGWRPTADLPRPAVAAPSPAPVVGGRLLVLGGDDGSKVGFKPEAEHPGFPRDVLAYDPSSDRWAQDGTVPFSRVTVPTAAWQGGWVVPSGEARPGFRSPEVWILVP